MAITQTKTKININSDIGLWVEIIIYVIFIYLYGDLSVFDITLMLSSFFAYKEISASENNEEEDRFLKLRTQKNTIEFWFVIFCIFVAIMITSHLFCNHLSSCFPFSTIYTYLIKPNNSEICPLAFRFWYNFINVCLPIMFLLKNVRKILGNLFYGNAIILDVIGFPKRCQFQIKIHIMKLKIIKYLICLFLIHL